MRVTTAGLPGVLILEPQVFRDSRGRFIELWNERRYQDAGIPGPFVQDNVSVSRRIVIRGLHYQHPGMQGKLVCVLVGEIFDVAVDVRYGSPTFGRWIGCTLSSRDHRQLYIPEGYAHGFGALSTEAIVLYKCTAPYQAATEVTVRWDDPSIGIAWPIVDPIVSEKDRAGFSLGGLAREQLPECDGRS